MFKQAIGLDNLWPAWERVRRNRGGAGGDGVGVGRFSEAAAANLGRLHRDLVNGTYRAGPLRQVDIPKKSGGVRQLRIPCVRDRIVQTAIAMALSPLLEPEMEDSSFAYRPGRSVQMAVDRVQLNYREGFRWVVDGDIERYFDHVPHPEMINTLARYVSDGAVIDFVAAWLYESGLEGRGLAQGSPLSPLLANLYLDHIDEQIEGRGVRLVRFADDFLLMCRDQGKAEKAAEKMAALLSKHGLRLHPGKTKIVPFERGFRFLGHLFVNAVCLPSSQPDEETGAETTPTVAGARADSAPTQAVPDTTASARKQVAADGGMDGRSVVFVDAEAPSGSDAVESDGLDAGVAAPTGSSGWRVVYVMTPHAQVRQHNQAISVYENDAEVLTVTTEHIDRIELGPHAVAASGVLRHAAANGIQVAYVNGWGETVGWAAATLSNRAALHAAQVACALDAERCLTLARKFVDGRVRNQRALLRRLNRRRNDPAVREACEKLNRTVRKIDHTSSLEILRGVEGEAASIYWPALGRTMTGRGKEKWPFRYRRRQPPPDPVNLLLSYTSALLGRDIAVAVQRQGLHPGIGCLHAIRDRGEACVYDLIEEFRAPLAEGLCVYLINNRIVERGMFDRNEDGSCHIDRQGVGAVIRNYEAWLARPIRDPASGRRISWRKLLERQAAAYRRHVLNEAEYMPYIMDY